MSSSATSSGADGPPTSEQPKPRSLRRRIIHNAGGQAAAHVARIVVQLGLAGVLLPVWGLQLYGDWLVLVGVAVFVGGSDFGYLTATAADMNVAVNRGDRELALDVFRTVARGLAVVFGLVLIVALVLVLTVPLVSVLHLRLLDETAAAAIVMMIAVQVLLLVSSLLLYGGFLCEGYYGEGVLIQSAIMVCEYGSACVVALLGGGPLLATAVLLAMRVLGTVFMYFRMRRRAPWLSLGRPAGRARVAKRLTRPALAMAAIGWGTALNVQAMTVIVGIAINPASAAIFATIRTLSRVVVQLTASISQAVGPEIARAFAERNDALVHALQRRITQTTVWTSVALIAVLAPAGDLILRAWTHGHVVHGGLVLDLLLISAALEGAWLTAASVLFFTNRHQGIGLAYALLWIAGLPLAYVLTAAFGRVGAALAVVAVGVLMLAEVLRQSLPAAHETLAGWIGSLLRPADIWQAFVALRAQIRFARGS